MTEIELNIMAFVSMAIKELAIEECAALNLQVLLYSRQWDEIPISVIGAEKLEVLKTENGKMHSETKIAVQKLIDQRIASGV